MRVELTRKLDLPTDFEGMFILQFDGKGIAALGRLTKTGCMRVEETFGITKVEGEICLGWGDFFFFGFSGDLLTYLLAYGNTLCSLTFCLVGSSLGLTNTYVY